MASNIQQFLNKILSSRYGKDVRQAIHDSIEQCYDDVTNPDLNTEAFETAVQNKIDSGALALMTIPDGSITKEKLGEDLKSGLLDIKLKNALLNCFSNVAWSNENGQVYYNELKKAFEFVKTMSLWYGGQNVTTKGEKIYSDLGSTLIGESGAKHGRVFASDIFKEDTTAKVTLIPSVNCYNPSYIGISKIDEWTLETSTSSTAYMYNAIKFSSMTVDMEYTATINVEPGYQVVFLIGGTNTVEPEIEVVGAVEE